MSLYDQFKMDMDAETKGVLVSYGDAGRFRIARAGGQNMAYTKALEEFQERYERQIALRVLDNETATRELAKIYARTVIIGWESGPEDDPRVGVIPGPDGNDLEFTYENCIQLLTDLPDLFADLRDHSNNLKLYREVSVQRDVGN